MVQSMQEVRPRRGLEDRPTLVLTIFLAVGIAILCILLGIRREERQRRRDHVNAAAVPIRYGQSLPPFRLAVATGGSLNSRELRGRWTLLVFAATWCPPCAGELQTLARFHKRLKRYVRTIPILEGPGGLLSPQAAAIGYVRRHGLPFDAAVDPDAAVGIASGATMYNLPHTVLIDPTGSVRLTTSGYSQTVGGSSRLVDGITAFFTGSAPGSMPFVQWPRCALAPDAPVTLRGGQRTRLSRLMRRGTLVLTFLTGGDRLEAVRIGAIRRFSSAPGARFLFVAAGPAACPARLGRGDGMLLAERDTGPLFAAYQVNRGPVSVLLHRGHGVIREEVAQPSGEAFETELAYAIFLGSAGRHGPAAREATPPARVADAAG